MFAIQETPYDLRFRVGSTPVRVQPLFWLFSALLGWSYFSSPGGSIAYLLLWIACCFGSVLLHELGHVWMGMAFGSRGHIVLWSFGGLAIGSSDLPTRWKRIAVYLAGPGIQLALCGIVWLIVLQRFGGMQEMWIALVRDDTTESIMWLGRLLGILFIVNLFWPLFNLLPVWPLDGGKVTRELCEAASREKGTETSLYISMGVCAVLALHCLLNQGSNPKPLIPQLWMVGGMFTGIFFAAFCIENYQALQMLRSQRRHWRDDDMPWDR